MLVNVFVADLVALATAVDVDGLKLGLGGDGHGGLDLDAENFMIFLALSKVSLSFFMYLLSGHDNFWGFDADSWHFYCFFF